jgi:hypothetical protein
MQVLKRLFGNVLFARQTNIQPKNQLVFYNRLKIRTTHLSISRWTLLHTYR